MHQGRLDAFVRPSTLSSPYGEQDEDREAKEKETVIGKGCVVVDHFLTYKQCVEALALLPQTHSVLWKPGRFNVTRVVDQVSTLVWSPLPWVRRWPDAIQSVDIAEYAGPNSGYRDWSAPRHGVTYLLCLGSAWLMQFRNSQGQLTNHWVSQGSLIKIEDPDRWTLSLLDKSVWRTNDPKIPVCKRTAFFRHIQVRFALPSPSRPFWSYRDSTSAKRPRLPATQSLDESNPPDE